MHTNNLALDGIVHSKRKAFREATVVPKNLFVNSSIEQEGVDIGEQRIQRVPSETCFLPFIKVKTIDQIRFCLVEDFNS